MYSVQNTLSYVFWEQKTMRLKDDASCILFFFKKNE